MKPHGSNPRHRSEERAKHAAIRREEKRADRISRAIAKVEARDQYEANLRQARIEIVREVLGDA